MSKLAIDLEVVKEKLDVISKIQPGMVVSAAHQRFMLNAHPLILELVVELEALRAENERLSNGRHEYKHLSMELEKKLSSQWVEKKCDKMAATMNRLSAENETMLHCLNKIKALCDYWGTAKMIKDCVTSCLQKLKGVEVKDEA